MTTITQNIPAIPGLPSGTAATPETYPPAAQAFADRLEDLPGELNALAEQMNAVAGEVNANAQTALAQATLATANGAEQVALAAGQAALATAAAAEAAASAAHSLASAAAAVSAAPAWDADAPYSYPQIAVGGDGQTYRCMGAGVVGDDPVNGSANWTRLTGASGGSPVFNFENCGGF